MTRPIHAFSIYIRHLTHGVDDEMPEMKFAVSIVDGIVAVGVVTLYAVICSIALRSDIQCLT